MSEQLQAAALIAAAQIVAQKVPAESRSLDEPKEVARYAGQVIALAKAIYSRRNELA